MADAQGREQRHRVRAKDVHHLGEIVVAAVMARYQKIAVNLKYIVAGAGIEAEEGGEQLLSVA